MVVRKGDLMADNSDEYSAGLKDAYSENQLRGWNQNKAISYIFMHFCKEAYKKTTYDDG